MLTAALCACSAEPVDESDGCVDYADPELYAAAATLAADVVPIFQTACNYNGCHNSRDVAQQRGLSLGPYFEQAPTEAELDQVHDQLVNVDAQLAAMQLVAAGDPGASFLLVKLEYADILACETVTCTELSCGRRMPFADPQLPAEQLKLIRTWIRDGAVR